MVVFPLSWDADHDGGLSLPVLNARLTLRASAKSSCHGWWIRSTPKRRAISGVASTEPVSTTTT